MEVPVVSASSEDSGQVSLSADMRGRARRPERGSGVAGALLFVAATSHQAKHVAELARVG